MLSYEEAMALLLDAALPQGRRERIDTASALGRILAEAVVSSIDVPPADNSAMDGYAIRVADLATVGATLSISQRIPAGADPAPLLPGTAARIFTGAPIPEGADAVVMQERCVAQAEGIVQINHLPRAGENVRRRGEDVAAGQRILAAGERLGPAQMGLAASVGVAQLEVLGRLRVAILFTGDELVEPGQPLPSGTIYNSNRYVLHGLLASLGCEVTDLGIVPDDLAATRAALREAAAGQDLVLTCGGVSVGEEDHVKAALQAEGVLESWQIAIKPGKPLAFGRVAATPFIGLPGNPVSSFVTFKMLVEPYIRKRQGCTAWFPKAIGMRADFDWSRPAPRREFLRVRRNAQGGLDLFPAQGSGVLTSCAWGDGLVDNPPGQAIQLGDMVRYIPFEGTT